jgi:hypothetical protein
VITSSGLVPRRGHREVAEAAIRGGATAVQLRVPELPDDELLPLAMVLAGPLLNWAVGLCLWRALPAVSREPPQRWWLLWLLLAYNLLVAAGYLVFCGLAGFGDWAVAMSPLLPAWVWRPLEVVGGAALYYLALRATSALVPLGAASPTRPNRLRTLVLLPYIGAGLVALAGGLLNPIDPIRRFLLPAASSFGAGLGLLCGVIGVGSWKARKGGLLLPISGLAVSFAASGNPSSRALPWPSIGNGTKVLSFVPSQSRVTTDFAVAHHCSFWAAG